MEQNWHDSILLGRQEFMILAALQGMEEISGIFHETDSQITQEEMVRILFELHQEGILSLTRGKDGAERTAVCEPVKQILEGIETAASYALLYRREQAGPALCCYLGRKVILSEMSSRDENTLKFYSVPDAGLLEELTERGYLPEREMEEEGQEKIILPPKLEELLRTETGEGALCQVPGVQSVLKLQKKDSAEGERLLVWLELGIRDVIVSFAEKKIQTFAYRKKYVRDILEGYSGKRGAYR